MPELSIEEQEFNLNKRMALFENRLNIQMAMLTVQYFDLIITDIEANIYAKSCFINTSISLIRERKIIKAELFNRFESGGIISGKILDYFIEGYDRYEKEQNETVYGVKLNIIDHINLIK